MHSSAGEGSLLETFFEKKKLNMYGNIFFCTKAFVYVEMHPAAGRWILYQAYSAVLEKKIRLSDVCVTSIENLEIYVSDPQFCVLEILKAIFANQSEIAFYFNK